MMIIEGREISREISQIDLKNRYERQGEKRIIFEGELYDIGYNPLRNLVWANASLTKFEQEYYWKSRITGLSLFPLKLKTKKIKKERMVCKWKIVTSSYMDYGSYNYLLLGFRGGINRLGNTIECKEQEGKSWGKFDGKDIGYKTILKSMAREQGIQLEDDLLYEVFGALEERVENYFIKYILPFETFPQKRTLPSYMMQRQIL